MEAVDPEPFACDRRFRSVSVIAPSSFWGFLDHREDPPFSLTKEIAEDRTWAWGSSWARSSRPSLIISAAIRGRSDAIGIPRSARRVLSRDGERRAGPMCPPRLPDRPRRRHLRARPRAVGDARSYVLATRSPSSPPSSASTSRPWARLVALALRAAGGSPAPASWRSARGGPPGRRLRAAPLPRLRLPGRTSPPRPVRVVVGWGRSWASRSPRDAPPARDRGLQRISGQRCLTFDYLARSSPPSSSRSLSCRAWAWPAPRSCSASQRRGGPWSTWLSRPHGRRRRPA